MRITEINGYNDFLSLEDQWNEVLQRCDHSVFSTFEWLSTWWKHCGNGKKLLLLLAEDDGVIIGIAPLMYSVHNFLGLRQGKIEFIGSQRPRSDYSDFILTDKHSECINLFVKHLKTISNKWDCIDLINVPAISNTNPYLKKNAKTFRPLIKCPYMTLPETYELFLGRLKRDMRKALRKNSRRLEENFEVDFADYSKDLQITEKMKIFVAPHQKRWKDRGYPGAFATKKIIDFHLDIAERFSKKGWLGLFQLNLSGVPAAARYGFIYKSKYYAYLTGLDPEFYHFGVGTLLTSFAAAQCIKEGLVEFDFMRGDEVYKSHWNTVTRWNHQAVLIRPGIFAGLQHSLFDSFLGQGNRLVALKKNLVPSKKIRYGEVPHLHDLNSTIDRSLSTGSKPVYPKDLMFSNS